MKRLFKIFSTILVALGVSSFLNACNVSKAPSPDLSVEEVGVDAAHSEATDHKCGEDHSCGESK